MRALEQRLRGHLEALANEGLLRKRRPPQGIDLSSNDYLGLAQHPLIKERMAAAVCAEGAGSTGSRLLRGERDCFTELEQRFAEFKGTERSLYFSSGYLANLAVLTTFPQAGDTIYSDDLNHASLIDGARLSKAERVVFPHLCPKMSPGVVPDTGFLVTESVFSMDGDIAPLEPYKKLGAALIVDEAHAVGVYGERGEGLVRGDGVFVSVNPAGKALGVAGAFVAGTAWAIEYLEQRARPFIFSTAAPPAVAAALDASLDVIAAEPERRERVRSLSRYLRARLTDAGIAVPAGDSPIIPVIVGENDRAVAVAAALQEAGFDVRAIRPPTVPQGTARLRISVNVNLSEEVLDHFVDKLCAVFVTGTDTGVGKTVLSAALMLRYPEACYWKPIQTGPDSDTSEVQRLSGGRVMDKGVRLPDPVSPHLAARLAGTAIEFPKPPSDEGAYIVEGAGGVLVPVNDSQNMADLMVLLGMPVIVATRTTLGTINHTLLTLEALRARALRVSGVVMIGEANPENRAAIERYGDVTVFAEMPRFHPLTSDALRAWAERLPKELV